MDGGASASVAEDRPHVRAPEKGLLSALSHSAFALVWGGALVSNVGNWIEITCQQWLVFKQSGDSPSHSGFLQAAVQLPGVFLAIPMGLLADRVDRRRAFLWFQVLLTVVAAVQAVAAHLNQIEPWKVIVIAFFESIAAAAMVPVWSSLLPDLVPRVNMGGAIALSSLQFNIARVLGPWLAGILVATCGYAIAFDANVVSFALVILALAIVRTRPRERPKPGPWAHELKEAFALVRRHRGLSRLIPVGATFLTLAAPQIPLMPALARRQLGGDVSTFAHLLSAMGFGAGVGALLMGVLARSMPRRLLIALGSAFVGATLIAAALSTNVNLSLVILFLFGLGWCVVLTAQNTAIQLLVPDAIRGRVMSLSFFCMMVPSVVVHLICGYCAEVSLGFTLGALGLALFALSAFQLIFPEPAIDGRPIAEEIKFFEKPIALPVLARKSGRVSASL